MIFHSLAILKSWMFRCYNIWIITPLKNTNIKRDSIKKADQNNLMLLSYEKFPN